MSAILILVGFLCVGFWGFYIGKTQAFQPLDFKTTGPIALIVGIILLVIGFSI